MAEFLIGQIFFNMSQNSRYANLKEKNSIAGCQSMWSYKVICVMDEIQMVRNKSHLIVLEAIVQIEYWIYERFN